MASLKYWFRLFHLIYCGFMNPLMAGDQQNLIGVASNDRLKFEYADLGEKVSFSAQESADNNFVGGDKTFFEELNGQFQLNQVRFVSSYDPGSTATGYLNAEGGLNVDIGSEGQLTGIFRVDGYWEHRGNEQIGVNKIILDAQDVGVNWSDQKLRASIGAYVVRWGKTDEISPVDRVVAEDFTRAFIEPISERRRAVLMMRAEYFGDYFSVDALFRPRFRKAQMPQFDSIWSPIDKKEGRLAGFASTPQLAQLVQSGAFKDPEKGDGGWAVRVSNTNFGVDWGVSIQRQRRSLPYYELTANEVSPEFVGRHPRRWIFGAELATQIDLLTVRAEAVYLSEEPVTTKSLKFTTVPAWEAVAGIDWWPGDKDVLLVLQLAGRYLDTAGLSILDRTHFFSLTGSVRTDWGRGDWMAETRYLVGLNKEEFYFNPRLTWTGWSPHQFILSGQFFSGSEDTLSGFYSTNNQVSIEWKVSW